MSRHEARARRSLLWTTAESVGLCLVSVLTLLAYAHYLSPRELGVGAMALAIVQLLALPVQNVFEHAFVQRRSVSDDHFDAAFVGSLGLGGVLAALCWVGAGPAARLLGDPAVADVLQWMGLSLPLLGASSALIGWHRRALDFRPIAVSSLLGRLLSGGIGVALAVAGAGVWSLVAQQLALAGISAFCIWIMASRWPRARFVPGPARELVSFGVFPAAAGFLTMCVPRVFILLVGGLLGSQVAGYFNLASRVVEMLRDILSRGVSQLLLPIFSRLQNDLTAMQEGARKAVPMVCAVLIPVFGGLAAVAPELVVVFFGEEWLPAAPIIFVMAILMLHNLPMMFVPPMMDAVGRPGLVIAGQLAQLLFVVAGMFLFAGLGVAAALAVWACRLVVSTPIDAVLLQRATGIRLWYVMRGAASVFAATAGMILAVLALRLWLADAVAEILLLVSMVATGAAAYGALMLLLGRPLLLGVAGFARSLLPGYNRPSRSEA